MGLSYTAGYLNCSRWSCTSLRWLEVMLDTGRWCRHGGDQCQYWETTRHHEETEQVPTGWWGNPRTRGLFPWMVERLLLQQLHFWTWESGMYFCQQRKASFGSSFCSLPASDTPRSWCRSLRLIMGCALLLHRLLAELQT